MEDQKVDEEAVATPPAEPSRPLLRWPPPGLERVQGDVWQVVRAGTLAALILVFPLLLVVSIEQEFWSLGPLGNAWWVILITMGVGAGLVLEALFGLVRLLRRTSRALKRGYTWKMVAHVACDARRDTGFLLQGARWYSHLDEGDRHRLAGIRIVSAALPLASILWLPLGLAVALLLAASGRLGEGAVTVFTLAPAATLLLMGLGARAWEEGLVRRARGKWFRQPGREQLTLSEIDAWRKDLGDVGGASERDDSLRHARALGYVVIGVGVLGALALFPPFALAPTAAVGPIMASVAIPRLAQTQERASQAEAFRPYRLPATGQTTPAQAGQLLQSIMFVGRSDMPATGEVEPVQRYFKPWFPPSPAAPGGPTGIDPRKWGTDLLPDAAHVSSDVLAYLDSIASHRAHQDFSRLAASAELDVLVGRWSLPFDAVGMATLPVPRFNHLREGAQAHIGKAVYQLALGDADAAELTIREVISVGFLMVDDAPTLIDNLLGFGLIGLGAAALEAFYETTDRQMELFALRQSRDATARASRVLARSNAPNLENALSQLPAIAASRESLRGLRWEFFTLTNTVSPCINLNRIVFGPGNEYERWVETVRASLVRWPSESHLFDLALRGYFGAPAEPSNISLLGRLFGVTMGGSASPGSCAGVFDRLSIGP